MPARSKARKRALDILFEAELRDALGEQVKDRHAAQLGLEQDVQGPLARLATSRHNRAKGLPGPTGLLREPKGAASPGLRSDEGPPPQAARPARRRRESGPEASEGH